MELTIGERLKKGRARWGHARIEAKGDAELLADLELTRKQVAEAKSELASYRRPDYAKNIETKTEKDLKASIAYNTDFVMYVRAILKTRNVEIPANPYAETK